MNTTRSAQLRRVSGAFLATAALIAVPAAHSAPQRDIPLVSEHGAGQIHPAAPQAIPFVSEHGAGQSDSPAPQAIPLVSEHGAGQSANGSTPIKTVVSGEPASGAAADGFDWGAAGVGAAVTLAAVALLGATALSTRQRKRLSGA